MDQVSLQKKIGVLGGGQLGRMIFQASIHWGLDVVFMENDPSCPVAQVCHAFVLGDITNYEDVMRFGSQCDIVTIEIENVNIQALEDLEKMGKEVYPSAKSLHIIRDKGLQKQFYTDIGLPTSSFLLFENKAAVIDAIQKNQLSYPFVQKLRKDGYDGKGVHIVQNENDVASLMERACLVEEKVAIDREIAVIVARSASGKMTTFPTVEMYFHPTANLVEFLFTPAHIDAQKILEAEEISKHIAEKLDIVGLLAVELFLDKEGQILINEVAPRPHNSGHHTIEACYTSQYEMLLRAILDLPLGATTLKSPAVMVNVLGSEGHEGPVVYEGLEDCLSMEGVHVHLYGKKITKPFRKMGHITIIDNKLDQAIHKAKFIEKKFKTKT